MTNEPAIIIKGKYKDWPGGLRELTSLDPAQRPRPTTVRFGALVQPDGLLVWFQIDSDEMQPLLRNTPADTAEERGARLVAALIAWLSEGAEHRLEDHNEFHVFCSDAGDIWIEPCDD